MADFTIPSGWNSPPVTTVVVQFQARTQPVFTPPAPVDWGWFNPFSEPIFKPSVLQIRANAWSNFTPTLDFDWYGPLSEPYFRKPPLRIHPEAAWSGFTPPLSFGWYTNLSEPYLKPAPLRQHPTTAWSGFTPAPDMGWLDPFPNPRQRQRPIQTASQTWDGDSLLSISWQQPLSEPIRRKRLADSLALAWSTFTPPQEATLPWFTPLSALPREGVVVSNAVFGFVAVEEPVAEIDQWFQPFSDPANKKKNPAAYQQTLTISLEPIVPVAPTFGWYGLLSEPVRVRRRLLPGAQPPEVSDPNPPPTPYGWYSPYADPTPPHRRVAYQQFYTADTETPPTFTEVAWIPPWSEPVRVRARLLPALNPVTVSDPKPSAPFGWYGWLAEPVRQKKGLRAPYQAPFFFYPLPVLNRGVMGWYANLSEPVREPKGLKAPYHQSYASIYEIIVNPVQVFLRMSVTEINDDDFSAGLNVFNPEPPPPSLAGASVVIIELPAESDGALTIWES